MLPLQSFLWGFRADLAITAARYRRSLIAGLLAAILLVTSYVAGMVALAIWIAQTGTALEATLTVCVINGVLALLILVYVMVRNRADRQLQLTMGLRLNSLTQQATAATTIGILQRRPIGVVATVAGVAFLATRLMRR